MRKIGVIALVCLAVLGCKKNERNAAEDTLSANVTMPQQATAPDTAPNAGTTSAAAATTTQAPVPASSPVDFPTYAATDSNVDVFAPQKQLEYDYLVDTFYAWPDNVVGWVKKKAPGLEEFQTKNRDRIVARRAREGYTPLKFYDMPALRTSSPHPLYSYAHTVIIYRKAKS